jgi:lysophospholipase L1-like esterase
MLAVLGAAAAAASGCDATLCYADSLAPFLARLNAGAPVHIIQIGDSHTAGDMITGPWRRRLQARYGNGGRGVLAAGRPYAGYLTWDVTASQSEGWSLSATSPLGISGFTQTVRAAGETLAVTADTPDLAFDRMIVCALTGPGGATIALRIGAAQASWTLEAPRFAPACRALASDAPAATASVATLNGGFAGITSFATFRGAGGVVLSNLGVVGAQLSHFARTDDAVVEAELAAYRPDLIVLAFGTNEGFSASLTPDGFEAALRAQIGRLRRLAGADVPMLLLGAPDAGTRAQGEGACGDGWRTPAMLDDVRARQRRVAREVGAAYWDWSRAMGGRCAASIWWRAGLMRGDHVHFTRGGGERIAAMIDADLLAAGESGH